MLLMAADLLWTGERPLPLSILISGGIFTLADSEREEELVSRLLGREL